MAVAGVTAIGGTCALIAVRAVSGEDELSASAAAIALLGAVGVVVSVVRWAPSLLDEGLRPLPRRHAFLLLGLCMCLGTAAIVHSEWQGAMFGCFTTVCLANIYLACWGYRSPFLLRRVVVFSVLSWPWVAATVSTIIHNSLAGPSDLVYRRLGSIGVSSAEQHPWRVLSAMNDHATVAVTGVVVLTLAASRVRVSLAAVTRLMVGSAVAMIVHHTLLLSTPIENYDTTRWARLASGEAAQLGVAVLVALALFSSASALSAGDDTPRASTDRDPEIFGGQGIKRPAVLMRICNVVLPTLLVTVAVVRP